MFEVYVIILQYVNIHLQFATYAYKIIEPKGAETKGRATQSGAKYR